MTFVFTCEHGGNRIPRRYAPLFKGRTRLLQSHRGWDRGALRLARACAKDCGAVLYYSQISRLLIDLNRSPRHYALFSPYAWDWDPREKQRICARYYYPYRQRVETAVREALVKPVIHLSFHSFTAELGGVVRNGDIGLLYDPSRELEREFCLRLQALLRRTFPQLAVRRNFPYRGTADGFTTFLRKRFPPRSYLGIELEINRKHVDADNQHWRGLLREMGCILRAAGASRGG